MIKQSLVIILLLFHTLLYAHDGQHLGKINFPTSANQTTQSHFKKGIMLLHSFEYREARLAFIKAQQSDPNFALAYWGEAMTYNHPLWQEVDFEKGKAALKKLASNDKTRIAKAKSPIEKGLIDATNVLYGKGSKIERDIAYANRMRDLYKLNPKHDEIAVFYALSLLNSSEDERNVRYYMQAAGIANEIYARNPQHPGALHYAIHAFDDPIHAPLGLPAARSYAKIAPDASHALHMPSHIFLALGIWDDVISSNRKAWEAGLRQNPKFDAKKFTIDDIHALEWLSYAYLQKRNFTNAYTLTKQMEKITREANSAMTKWYYALMRARYIIESKDYQTDLQSFDMRGLELSARASDAYVNAQIALFKGEKYKVKEIVTEMQNWMRNIDIKDSYPDFFVSVTQSGIKATKIMILELKALDGNEAFLHQATQLEDNMSFGYGPPIPPQPAYELLGEKYLNENKPAKAYQAFKIALERAPNRFAALQGLKKALFILQQLGRKVPVEAKQYFNRLMLPEFYH